MLTKSKNLLYITLFEEQLIRTYLLSDHGILLKKLSSKYQLIIITNSKYRNFIEENLTNYRFNPVVKIIEFNNYQYNWLSKFCQSILHFISPSRATFLTIKIQYEIEKKTSRLYLRYMLYYIFSRFRFVKNFIRLVYKLSLTSSGVERSLSEPVNIFSHSLLFITSLSPLRGEDVPIAAYLGKRGVKTVGTVRSWDNLVSNGCLTFIPDKFLSHSEYMVNAAIEFQGISKHKIISFVTPSYQAVFCPQGNKRVIKKINIAYMCMGLTVNPDDYNFVKWLINTWGIFPINFELTIVQHPQFVMKGLEHNLPKNVKFKVFKFSETSLYEYYNFLNSMELIVAGGTTGILDASYLNLRVIAVGFETIKQNYWRSGMRYFDYYPHTADFFESVNIPIAKSKKELIDNIRNYNKIKSLDRNSIIQFTGDPDVNLARILMDTFQNF